MKITNIRFQYFNQCQNVYISATGENLIPKFDKVIDMSSTEHMHYGENEHGIVNFGLWNDVEQKRPDHKGFWSSREAIISPLINKKLIPIGLNGYGVSMIVEKLEEHLPEEYHIVPRNSAGELVYEVQRKDGINEDCKNPSMVGAGYHLG